MKKNHFKIYFILFFVWLAVASGSAKAEVENESATIHLKIATHDAILYDQNINVLPCADSETASTTSINAKCSIEQSGLVSDWSFWGEDAFLNSLGSYINNDKGNGVYWGWFNNLEYGQVALNKHLLAEGDKLLLTYNTNPLRISADNLTSYVNATSTVIVEQFGLDSSWNPVWQPAASSTLVMDGEELPNESGTYIYTPLTAGEHSVYAKKAGYLDSDNLTLTAMELATNTIRLQIKTHDASLYNQDITVIACAPSPVATTTTVNAKCAIEQSGLISDWSYWGDDAFLNSLGGYANNANGNGVYWGWFSNLEYGQTALNKHELINGEKLLLAYNVNPLRISIATTTVEVNATTTISVEQFGLDANWNQAWLPAASSTLVINGQNYENAAGLYEYAATTTGEHIIYAKKEGYIDSEQIIIIAEQTENNNGNNNPPPSGGSVIIPSGGGGGSAPSMLKVDLVKAVDFLNSKQKDDGSFGSALQTDWAAIALASVNPNGLAGQKVKSYLLTDPNPLVGLNSVSDYSRRAMALMSLNINPYDGTKTNYIKKIADSFDGAQFGDSSLYNDDIFALLVLSKAGYSAGEEIIFKPVANLISKQESDGSWQGVDLTAAAVQALKPFSYLDGVAGALNKARSFLARAQASDGGFNNIFATAWAMQAISALGENPASWTKGGNNPESFLALSQGSDGGLDKENNEITNRIWATSYALPAVQGKSWPDIMSSFNKPTVLNLEADNRSGNHYQPNLIATSSLNIMDIATTSPESSLAATSTESRLEQIATTTLEIIQKVESAPALIKSVAKQEVLGKKIVNKIQTKIAQPTNQPKTIEKTENNKKQENIKASEALSNPKILSEAETPEALNQPENNINSVAKKVLIIAGAGTVIVGLFLGLKLLKGLI